MKKVYKASYKTAVFTDYFLSLYCPKAAITWAWNGEKIAIIWKDFDDYLDTVEPLERIREYFN